MVNAYPPAAHTGRTQENRSPINCCTSSTLASTIFFVRAASRKAGAQEEQEGGEATHRGL